MITDIDALLPDPPEPVATMILERTAQGGGHPGVVAHRHLAAARWPDPRTGPDLCDRELGLSLPDAATRKALEVLFRDVPAQIRSSSEIADRTPGFVRADLAALVREAALRAAGPRQRRRPAAGAHQDDLDRRADGDPAVVTVGHRGGVGRLGDLEDVGDMVSTKQALTEAVLWPLQHPTPSPAWA